MKPDCGSGFIATGFTAARLDNEEGKPVPANWFVHGLFA